MSLRAQASRAVLGVVRVECWQHLMVHLFFVGERVKRNEIKVACVPSNLIIADGLTKPRTAATTVRTQPGSADRTCLPSAYAPTCARAVITHRTCTVIMLVTVTVLRPPSP